MSSLVLLDRNGVVARKLQLVSLPKSFVIPEGMTVSWRKEVDRFSHDPVAEMFGTKEPMEAFFYLGNAQGQVCRTDSQDSELRRLYHGEYAHRVLTITVQGTSTKDVMALRDHIMQLIHSNARWDVSNDLNPKPKKGLWRTLKEIWEE